MIHSKEINTIAAKNKLKDTQIEKDYILSWALYGIACNEQLSKQLVLKGLCTAIHNPLYTTYGYL